MLWPSTPTARGWRQAVRTKPFVSGTPRRGCCAIASRYSLLYTLSHHLTPPTSLPQLSLSPSCVCRVADWCTYLLCPPTAFVIWLPVCLCLSVCLPACLSLCPSPPRAPSSFRNTHMDTYIATGLQECRHRSLFPALRSFCVCWLPRQGSECLPHSDGRAAIRPISALSWYHRAFRLTRWRSGLQQQRR